MTYKAFDVHLQRPAALKIINAQIFDNARPLYKGSSRPRPVCGTKSGPQSSSRSRSKESGFASRIS